MDKKQKHNGSCGVFQKLKYSTLALLAGISMIVVGDRISSQRQGGRVSSVNIL